MSLFDSEDKESLFTHMDGIQANLSSLTTGNNELSFIPDSVSNFNVSLNISLTAADEMVLSTFTEEPVSTSVANIVFYFEIWFNDTSKINFPINITIEYTGTINYTSFEFYYYNESTGVWDLVPVTVDGNTITIQINHASLFALGGVTPDPGTTGDTPPGDTQPAIPFGNYFYIFLAMGIVGLLVFRKKSKYTLK